MLIKLLCCERLYGFMCGNIVWAYACLLLKCYVVCCMCSVYLCQLVWDYVSFRWLGKSYRFTVGLADSYTGPRAQADV